MATSNSENHTLDKTRGASPTRARSTQRRVLVALEGRSTDRLVLEAIDFLAVPEAHDTFDLIGVFLEDAELLQFAELPIAVELCHATSNVRQINRADLEKELGRRADLARLELSRIAKRSGGSYSFEVERGHVLGMLRARAKDVDVVAFAAATHAGWSYAATNRSGTTAPRSPRPVAVVFDETPAAGRALSLAIAQARHSRCPLTIVAIAPSQPQLQAIERRAVELVGSGFDTHVHLKGLLKPSSPVLITALAQEQASMIILPAPRLGRRSQSFTRLRLATKCPTFLVS